MTPSQQKIIDRIKAGTHVLVPVEPTEAMIVSAMDCIADGADPYDTCVDITQAAQEGE